MCQEMVKDSTWLMVDPWESIYSKTYLNFTDVLNRLELYLQKHVHKNIKVAYVFGADNARFMYCFKQFGLGVCIERKGYEKYFNETKLALNNDRNIFIKNKKKVL